MCEPDFEGMRMCGRSRLCAWLRRYTGEMGVTNSFDKLDKVVCYQGGKQHFSVIAFTDIILGAVSGVGYGDSYYRNGRILKENHIGGTQTAFPGVDTPVYMKSYLSEEMIKAAKACGIKELHWMNSVFR